MPTTFNYSGKPAFMYDQESDQWLQLGGAIDTSSAYTWAGVNAFSNDVSFTDSLTSKEGINNFLNPAARDAAIPSPVHGTVAFLRQDGSAATINQWQYYNGSAWVANDGDISSVTAGDGLTGGGTAGALTLNIGTAATSRVVVNADSIDLATSGVTSGTYVTATITVDAYGRVTSATDGSSGLDPVYVIMGAY